MRRLGSAGELVALRQTLAARRDAHQVCVTVCGGTGCRAKGSEAVVAAFRDELAQRGLAETVGVMCTGCHGFCERGPVVMVGPQQVFYQGVTPGDVPEIVSATVAHGGIVERLLYSDPVTGHTVTREQEVPFYQQQKRIILDQNGLIDPASIGDYIALGGYGALSKALGEMTPEQVIEEVLASRLRGRGGAGFPTGLKWRFCRQAAGDLKYVVCNADEGDPGAYMDRSLIEGNPHRVLEGMIIGAYAIGARQGFVYIRNEYPLAVEHLRTAIAQACEYGLLGEDILGSRFGFDVEIRLGSGAFVCGEETALIASIEGQIGEPRPRPPFPTQLGLWGRPTNVNNVETWANVPVIVERGAAWYRQLGTEESGGTKIFSLVGKVNNTGLVEVPLGTPLGEIIFDIGGGIARGRRFKAAQLGGPAGGCVAGEHLNVVIDYAPLQEVGAIMGSGGLVVCDEDTCMVDLARFFLRFTQEESCGKCLPCRVGTRAMLATLERICAGQGREGDIEYLVELGEEIRRSALCGLGQNAPNPVLTTVRYFRHEYEAHIQEKRCPAGVCQDLFLAPCQNECPLGTNVPGYVSLLGEGRFREALSLILDTNPFPSVCGRVCDHLCEAKCRRAQLDEPVAIRALKRFVAGPETRRLLPPRTGDAPRARASRWQRSRVGIVGAGPAGLSCACFLARLGYAPVVFERLPVAGGMLAVGIPEYRLPKRVLQREIAAIQALGVEIRTNVAIGQDVTLGELRRQGYEALFLAVGAQEDRRLAIPGEELPGVVSAIGFLREMSLNGRPELAGRRVAVVGGGNVAVDAARSALRLGAAKVCILYRRTRAEMPAQPEEVAAAEAEGVAIHTLLAPARIVGGGEGVRAVECVRMRPGEFDRSGRRRPVPDSAAPFELAADLVIPAIGQLAGTAPLLDGLSLEAGPGGTIRVDPDGRTGVPFIFAGGDVTTGPSTVVRAIAAGQRAAAAIDRYLHPGGNRVFPWQEQRPAGTRFDPDAEPVPYARCLVPEMSVADRLSFAEVEQTLSREAALREAARCLRCDYRETEV
jgi:NADH-quinone oxidoreductase subunit F